MDLEKHLNPHQLEAALHVEGPFLVIAGAGSGKTRLVTYRIMHLLDIGVPSSEILAVTFTNKAAEEMRRRIQTLAGALILTCTFHSLGARILRESISYLGYSEDFAIFDEEDSEKVLKQCLADKGLKDEKGMLKTLKAQISDAKNQLIEAESLRLDDAPLFEIYTYYQNRLKQYNAVDFDDLLFLTVRLLQQFPEVRTRYQKRWNFVLIDEYQDTNFSQHTLVKLLCERSQNVFAVGDPDQSIYSWRGANVDNILNFEKDFPGAKTVTLDQNYRSRSTILNAANALIQHNESHYKKTLWSDRGEGEKIGIYLCDQEREEVAFVVNRLLKQHQQELTPLNECAIFYRTHFQSRVFEDGLLKARIPYIIVGGVSFYMRKEIKDILALLRMALSPQDYVSFSRTLGLRKRGIGETTLSHLRLYAEENEQAILSTCLEILNQKSLFKLSQKQTEGLSEYVAMIQDIQSQLRHNLSIHELIRFAIERSHYYAILQEDPETFQERRENIEELITKAHEWEEEVDQPTLASFLEELSLKSSLEEKDLTKDAVRLMTLHNSKGLEFHTVFLVGMEEELFPHANALGNQQALEEERRLCYVGMTRAKEHLYLSAARTRLLWGTTRIMRASRFLSEVPPEYLQKFHSLSPAQKSAETDFMQDPYQEESASFSPGDSVRHKDFGYGIVKKSYNTSLGLTYDVYFPEKQSLRTLVAKYAKLIATEGMDKYSLDF